MTLRVEKTPRADLDLLESYSFIAADSPAAAGRFIAAAQGTFEFLAPSPGVGRAFPARAPHLRPLRIWPISGFRAHLVFYTTVGKRLVIARVIHAARDLESALG